MRRAPAALLSLALLGCPSEDGAKDMPRGPALVVLGTAQDGGLPHVGCSCERCARARTDPGAGRKVASAAVVAGAQAWLIDATPDLPAQLEDLAPRTGRPRGGVDRAPLAGLFLTHAHVGHYVGLALLGFEALHAQALPVHASPRMAAFLRDNAPWDQLVRLDNVRLHMFEGAGTVTLAGGVTVAPLQVPHRDEYTDTHGFVIAGPRARALYVPDSAPWAAWPRPLPEVLAAERIDVALLDGCFYSPDELPGRDLATLAHPLIVDTMDLLQPLIDAGGVRVIFTHLNHSNPAVDPGGAAALEIRRRGFEVARDGLEIPL
ncbi:MBL fold metallo-hydrolase [Nannocystis punicea]|uniref:MBL fold metallo-hydrolase n=1 Tax=Nannocystis punicea TaxID=2995304 RepID=A0ABY7GVN0_9BACT|nr:MBL fold metallo-hydrolase [Nannocystis poenicansa]WAS91031.1 MBL fold metallo-hydrolase [Nannocystis poenicansa]